jgi:hypothetical protein
MSSPIHHADNINPALIYAPPRVREGERGATRPPRRYSGDVAVRTLQRQLALDPEAIPEPPAIEKALLWPMVRRLGAVAAIAALAAWGIVLLPGPKKSGAIVAPELPPAPLAANRVKLVHVEFATASPQLSPEKFVGTSEPVTAPLPSVAALIPPQPVSSPQGSPPDSQEIAMLVKRGKDFLVDGDLASARLLLKRAAEDGSAEGALALGASFDPLVIKRLGAIGVVADIAQARAWYQKAAQLGSPDASQQLAKLAPSAQ